MIDDDSWLFLSYTRAGPLEIAFTCAVEFELQSSQGFEERKKHLDICVNSYLG